LACAEKQAELKANIAMAARYLLIVFNVLLRLDKDPVSGFNRQAQAGDC